MNYKNRKIVLQKRPDGFPEEDDFNLVSSEINELHHGEVIIEVMWLSLDPYMRGRMSAAKSYALPINIGDVVVGGAVGKVVESKCNGFKVGDIVEGFTIGWQEYARVQGSNLRIVDHKLAPIQTAVGVLGMPGMTAYFGLFDTGKKIFFEDIKKASFTAMWAFAQAVTLSAGIITYPLDTVRRRLMMNGGKTGADKIYDGNIDCIRKIYRYEGIRGFFKGCLCNVYRWSCGPLTYVLYDKY